jgi:hypothetical protein
VILSATQPDVCQSIERLCYYEPARKPVSRSQRLDIYRALRIGHLRRNLLLSLYRAKHRLTTMASATPASTEQAPPRPLSFAKVGFSEAISWAVC